MTTQIMNAVRGKGLLLTACFSLIAALSSVKAQSVTAEQPLDYHELKGLLLKPKPAVERILSLKRFKPASTKERPESSIYAFRRDNDSTQVLVRVRKRDGLVSEVAWTEKPATLGNLTHEAVYDGFVPVGGNSRYYNRFQKLALLVNYALVNEDGVLPCSLRAVE